MDCSFGLHPFIAWTAVAGRHPFPMDSFSALIPYSLPVPGTQAPPGHALSARLRLPTGRFRQQEQNNAPGRRSVEQSDAAGFSGNASETKKGGALGTVRTQAEPGLLKI